uniref:Helix-turn-helix domain-containing protein n=1 Tax=Octopus bimaculoides TaxID=37653 RepID=A0A0L8FT24_OCTBM
MSISPDQLSNFSSFISNFHPSLQFTSTISDTSVNFLDIFLSIDLPSHSLITSVFFKPTDSHLYFNFSSSHPCHTKRAIPYFQFLYLSHLCSRDQHFQIQPQYLACLFMHRRYPSTLAQTAITHAHQINPTTTLSPSSHQSPNHIPFPSLHPTPSSEDPTGLPSPPARSHGTRILDYFSVFFYLIIESSWIHF